MLEHTAFQKCERYQATTNTAYEERRNEEPRYSTASQNKVGNAPGEEAT